MEGVNITHRGEYHLTITLLLSWAPQTAISHRCTLKISVAPLAPAQLCSAHLTEQAARS